MEEFPFPTNQVLLCVNCDVKFLLIFFRFDLLFFQSQVSAPLHLPILLHLCRVLQDFFS